MHELRTERLHLRAWKPSDRAPFAAMNADPRVMQHFEAPLTAAGTDALIERITQQFEADGFGLWAVEIPGVTSFAGFIGLYRPNFEAHFTPCVEIGWRLAAEFWITGMRRRARARRCASASRPSASTSSWRSPCQATSVHDA